MCVCLIFDTPVTRQLKARTLITRSKGSIPLSVTEQQSTIDPNAGTHTASTAAVGGKQATCVCIFVHVRVRACVRAFMRVRSSPSCINSH